MANHAIKLTVVLFYRNVKRLIEALEPVLDDPLKLQMLHCISRLLPPNAQLEFEQLAVEMVARHMDSMYILLISLPPLIIQLYCSNKCLLSDCKGVL